MKSRFIALVLPFNNIVKLSEELDKIKHDYPKARHYLYAYRVHNLSKSNDDKEPGSIAKGILNLINQKELDQILVVVVRYFGGVKLGASRLLRTYLNVSNEALKLVEVKELRKVFVYLGRVDYKTFNQIKSSGYLIANAKYFDTIEIEIISKDNILDKLKQFEIKDLKVKEVEKLV